MAIMDRERPSTSMWFLNNAHLFSILDIGNTPVTTHIAGSQFDLL
jgi:hypothetical protein